jgi:hypothetical protein
MRTITSISVEIIYSDTVEYYGSNNGKRFFNSIEETVSHLQATKAIIDKETLLEEIRQTVSQEISKK